MRFSHELGTYYSFGDNKRIINSFDNLLFTANDVKFAGCFSCYFTQYDEKFTWAQPIVPFEINEIIENINKQYKNIKYIILKDKPVYLKVIRDSFTGGQYAKAVKEETDVKKKMALFTLELNKDYSPLAKKYMQYVLHHMMRMLSYTENAFITLDDKLNIKNPLEDIIKFNNRATSKYRAVSEREIKIENLLYLDNIEACNQALNTIGSGNTDSIKKYLKSSFSYGKQTNILLAVEAFIENSKLRKEIEEEEKRRKEIEQKLLKGNNYTIHNGYLYEIKLSQFNENSFDLYSNSRRVGTIGFSSIEEKNLISKNQLNFEEFKIGDLVKPLPIAEKIYLITNNTYVQELKHIGDNNFMCTKSSNKEYIGVSFLLNPNVLEKINV